MGKVLTGSSDQLIDHILTFDPEVAATSLKTSTLQPEFLSPKTLPPIPWPKGLAPSPKKLSATPDPEAPLPRADVLIVTWTVAEAMALSDILTPNFRSKDSWYNYTHNWVSHFRPIIKGGAPSLNSKRLGSWFRTKIGKKNVICFKSELHFARDGAKLPIKDLWIQLIAEVQPTLVITTGTAGGVGANVQLGDVALTKKVRFDCTKTFKNASFRNSEFVSKKNLPLTKVSVANDKLMEITTSRLPQSSRTSQIITKTSAKFKKIDVVTTDFFAFDDSTDLYKLQSLGLAVEMGDAVLGLACSEMVNSPDWLAIRNASDPQIDGTLAYKDQVQVAARTYEKYGYWTTVNSAIACWAVVASLK
ncbi:phosphorylase family protein [Flavitalea flava]